MSGSTVWNIVKFIFIDAQVEDYKNILKLRCWPLAFIFFKSFLKNEKRSGTKLAASFKRQDYTVPDGDLVFLVQEVCYCNCYYFYC